MREFIDVFDLQGNFLETQDRKSFYDEIEKEFNQKGIISKKVKVVNVLILNSKGRIYLQKRSTLKSQNSGLYDKTVGGHVNCSQSYDVTVIKECAEELGFPVAVIKKEEFEDTLKSVDLTTVGIITQIKIDENFVSKRIMKDNSYFNQPTINAIYIGYYNGSIKFVDGESSGIEVMSTEELDNEIKLNSNKFTEDLKHLFNQYKQYLKIIED